MGIQKKHGKGRLDKWYKLAKEKGYRARAAFKLIQLNRKYGFLERSKVLLDLCAAPGSWCQVAAETMPINSLILGVDLAPIKPIPRTTTFQGDITSEKCRATIRQHFKTWKVDTVLHDGAPNVGTAWVQDAFSQAELALQALKLASEFLVEGGTFVTKVFRSKDYNALLWVCNQLFSKVEATKPPSSRSVSAEIFVVCGNFKAPKRIDPRLLDPRSVFAELSNSTPNNEAKVFNPEKKKRKREGYEEGAYTQFREAAASEFIQSTDPIAMLGSFNRLKFASSGSDDSALAALVQLPETTIDIKLCCEDLKVLGRKEFRMLLRWRLKARKRFGLASTNSKKDILGEEVAEITPMHEELNIQEELLRLDEYQQTRKKKERRRANEKKQKDIVRMQLNMLPPTEIGLEQAGPNGEDSIFTLAAVNRAGAIERISKGEMGTQGQKTPQRSISYEGSGTDSEGDGLERDLDTLYEEYQQRRSDTDAKYRARKSRAERDEGEWTGIAESVTGNDEDIDIDHLSLASSEAKEIAAAPSNHGKVSFHTHSGALTNRASVFFAQDIFMDAGVHDAVNLEDYGSQMSKGPVSGEQGSITRNSTSELSRLRKESTPDQVIGEGDTQYHGAVAPSAQISTSMTEPKGNSIKGTYEIVSHTKEEDQYEPQKVGRLDIDIITAEAMTLARHVAAGTTSTRDLVDDGFNKYSFRAQDGLPQWFLDDEGKHSRLQRPIDAAAAAAIKEKFRALNARPIKKVREAKERKKFKTAQRLEKLRTKSAFLADESGVSEKDKAQNITNLMGKAVKKRPKQQVKLVVARGGNRGISGRPRGVKGKYKIVDARLKKDTRAEKRLATRK
ncbi:MAG: hypothetical protein Q9197_003505 [Variospora fuerteventurae]